MTDMSDSAESNPADLTETPAEAAAEAKQTQLDAQAAVAEEIDGDGEGILSEEEGLA
ncbi:hypothetical protein [Jongsikchunia kroppenstedtii]|uniref:hypothetical protein n=1 Tax=Jongsikchunia kroppenstedtii TaxID=1121721 RepID=UPI00037BDD26|nr:hypothetical protein [Jongsikchunia kroppenstedtii]